MRLLLRTTPVADEDARLDRGNRPSPAAGRGVLEALAITLDRAVEPLPRAIRIARDQMCEPGARSCIPHARQLPLPRIVVSRVRESRLPVQVRCFLPLRMRSPIRHGKSLRGPNVNSSGWKLRSTT